MANFERGQYGFWRQTDAEPFDYSLSYKDSQSTNNDMSYLRLGWLATYVTPNKMRDMKIVDVGSGNGTFVRICKPLFREVYGYDVNGESISRDQLYGDKWDLIVLSDVLEHFEDINDLFKIHWKFAFISFPETPQAQAQEELAEWRHYKPNEHLWMLNRRGVCEWLKENGRMVVAVSNFEDIIRRPWSLRHPNITSVLAMELTNKQ